MNITCIIARFKPGEYSDEYSPPGQYETVDYTSRAIFSDVDRLNMLNFLRNSIAFDLNIDHRATKLQKSYQSEWEQKLLRDEY